MFVRTKEFPGSQKKCIQIVKSIRQGNTVNQKIVKHIGCSEDEKELEELRLLGEFIKDKLLHSNTLPLFSTEELYDKTKLARIQNFQQAFDQKKGKKTISYTQEDYMVNMSNLEEEVRFINGIHDIYGELFDELNLKSIFKNPARQKAIVDTFKNVVLARIANPDSKKSSVHNLEENFGITLSLDYVYKMMDKLDDEAIEKLNNLAYKTTLSLFGKIDVVFFDATTIYFESFTEDEFKKNGYSKDLKFNQPQVLLALMVTDKGLPIGYEAYSGNTYEGHTLLDAISKLKAKYNIRSCIYVADSGMFNQDNLKALEERGFDYIVGARIKNLPNSIQQEILNTQDYIDIDNIKAKEINFLGKRLIVTYSQKRADKDKKDRLKQIEKLEKKLAKHKNPKEFISNSICKKYLQIEQDKLTISIRQDKIQEDEKWDGLKGIIVKSDTLSIQEALSHYRGLYQVEESFRITKHDLKVRPVYHYKPQRVKAHLAICFAAYILVRQLEYRVALQYKKLSFEYIRRLLIDIQTSIVVEKTKRIRYAIPSKISKEAKKIYQIMGVTHQTTPYIVEKF